MRLARPAFALAACAAALLLARATCDGRARGSIEEQSRALHALERAADEAEKDGRLAEALELRMRQVREVPDVRRFGWGADAVAARVDTIPPALEVRVAGCRCGSAPVTARVALAFLESGAPLRVEVLDPRGGVLRSLDLDPACFHDLVLDVRGCTAERDPPTTADPAVLAWLEETRAHPPSAAVLAASPGTGEESFEAWCGERRRLYAAWRAGAPPEARAWLDELLTMLRRLARDPPDLGDRRVKTDDCERVYTAWGEIGRRGRALGLAAALVVPCVWGPPPEGHVDRGAFGRLSPRVERERREQEERDRRREPDPERTGWTCDAPLLTLLDEELVRTGAIPLSALARPLLDATPPRLVLPSTVGPGEAIAAHASCPSLGFATAPFPLRAEVRVERPGGEVGARAPAATGTYALAPVVAYAIRDSGSGASVEGRLSLAPASLRVVEGDPDDAVDRVPLDPMRRGLPFALPFAAIEGGRDVHAPETRLEVRLAFEVEGEPPPAPLVVKLACALEGGGRFELPAAKGRLPRWWTQEREGVCVSRIELALEATVPTSVAKPRWGHTAVRATMLPDPRAARLAGLTRILWFAPVALEGDVHVR